MLYGDRGTGKSSTIKAILNEYYDQGLRIIEIPKKYLMDFTDIIRTLEGRKQKFSDRAGLSSSNPDEEIHAADTIQEKLSLADRFGIKVTFSSPDKCKFLQIVDGIAQKRGLKVDEEYLHQEALKWELFYNGRSPRTAKQFIDWLEGSLNFSDKI